MGLIVQQIEFYIPVPQVCSQQDGFIQTDGGPDTDSGSDSTDSPDSDSPCADSYNAASGEATTPESQGQTQAVDRTTPPSQPMGGDSGSHSQAQPVDETTGRSAFLFSAGYSAAHPSTSLPGEVVGSCTGRTFDQADGDLQILKEALDTLSLPEEQRLLFHMLLNDVQEGRSKLKLDRKTGKVTVNDVSEEVSLAARIPENTLKIADVSKKNDSKRSKEVEIFCNLIDDIKRKSAPGGVVLNSRSSYKEGNEYRVNGVLGKGLNAVVKLVTEKKSGALQAEKDVDVHNFQSNEIRAMYDLQTLGCTCISPQLYGFQLHKNSIKLNMEMLDGYITVKDVVKQLCRLEKSQLVTLEQRFQFALSVLHIMAESVRVMHSFDWYHRDLHSENMMLGKCNTDNLLTVKIIDFGTAKSKIELESADEAQRRVFLDSIYYDMRNILRHFCSLVLGAEHFKDRVDFKNNCMNFVSGISNNILPKDKKDVLLSILKQGFLVSKVNDEAGLSFIEMVKTQVSQHAGCGSGNSSVQTVVSHLNFSAQPGSFVDLAAAGSTPSQEHNVYQQVQNQTKPNTAMCSIISEIQNFSLSQNPDT